MQEQEALFQEKMERLEAGEPMSTWADGLSEEEIGAIKLIASLRDMVSFKQDEEAIAAYRIRMLNVSAQESYPMTTNNSSNPVTEPSWLKRLQAMVPHPFNQRVLVGAVMAVFVGMCLFLFGAAAIRLATQDSENEVAEMDSNSDKLINGDQNTPLENGIESTQDQNADEAAATTGASPNTLFVPVLGNPVVANAHTAVIQDIRGRVEVQDSAGIWTPVSYIGELTAGQNIRTGPFSSATIAYFDGSQAILGPNSELALVELNAQLPEVGFRTVVMTQIIGESEHHVAFRNDGGSRYEVQTASGNGLARGTIFRVLVTPQLLTRFTVAEGKVDVTSLNQTVSVLPGQLTKVSTGLAPGTPVYQINGEGEVSQTGSTWIIAGQSFQTDSNTIIVGAPQVGDQVQVEGHTVADGVRLADRIILLQPENHDGFHLTGEVETIGETGWTVAGQLILVNEETEIESDIAIGDTVRVEGEILPDGSLLAEEIFLLEDGEGFPFNFTGVVQQIEPTAWVVSGQLVMVDEGAEIDPGIELGDVVQVRGRILPDSVWLARSIQLVSLPTAEFSLTGIVQSINPWVVANVPFTTNEGTVIDEGIEVGDLVRVFGLILPDGTWVATHIFSLEDPDPNVIILIGIVTYIDPWSVNGLPLVVNGNTLIGPGIEVGTQVIVHILIQSDGSWLALSILPLHPHTGIGCITIAAVVMSVNGNQVILQNYGLVVLDNNIQVTGDIQPDTVVIITICTLPDGTIIIITIIVIYQPVVIVPPPPNPGPGGDSVTICHKGRTITVSWSGWINGHSKHGDTLGSCG